MKIWLLRITRDYDYLYTVVAAPSAEEAERITAKRYNVATEDVYTFGGAEISSTSGVLVDSGWWDWE